MNRLFVTVLIVLSALALHASPTVPGVDLSIDRTAGTADVHTRNASLSNLIRLAEMRSGTFVNGAIPDYVVTIHLRGVPIHSLIDRIAEEVGLLLVRSPEGNHLIDPSERLVNLNVVDARLDAVVESVARQCGIRNVMIDPGLDSKGTFVLLEVPCSTALPVVFRTLGIEGELHRNSILVVRKSR